MKGAAPSLRSDGAAPSDELRVRGRVLVLHPRTAWRYSGRETRGASAVLEQVHPPRAKQAIEDRSDVELLRRHTAARTSGAVVAARCVCVWGGGGMGWCEVVSVCGGGASRS